MLIGVRVGVRTPIRTGRIEATPKDGFGPVPRGLATTLDHCEDHKEVAPMEPTRNPLSGLYERIVSDPVHLAFYNARVARGPGCWEWQGKKNSGGYGQVIITLDGKKRGFMAPRVALTIKLGREPVGDTRHTCDNPPCCNPDHLIEGSRSENMRDAYQRGRIDMDAVLRGIREYAEKRRAAQLPIPPADETGWSE